MNFWSEHGIFFVIFMFFFPRITLFFSSIASGGLLWWLGFIFAPRLLVAVLATIAYRNTNEVLVLITWIWAVVGEGAEKKVLGRKVLK